MEELRDVAKLLLRKDFLESSAPVTDYPSIWGIRVSSSGREEQAV